NRAHGGAFSARLALDRIVRRLVTGQRRRHHAHERLRRRQQRRKRLVHHLLHGGTMRARRIVDGLCLGFALLLAAPLAPARSGEPLASAQRHMRELRYESARTEVERSIRRGHHTRKELVALYALRAELASIMDGPSVGESAFRRLL